MNIPVLESVKAIEYQYSTGETPVLVMCSDMNAYVCKYMRSSASAFKLACELIGSQMAMVWDIETPSIAFVQIKPDHWTGRLVQHSISAPSLGSRLIESAVDINSSTFGDIESSVVLLRQLMKIALFDFWLANEDRNINNANLIYNLTNDKLVSIDYGCILNTATFDYGMTQLTSNESILCSDLFLHLVRNKEIQEMDRALKRMKDEYMDNLNHCKGQIDKILMEIPSEWHIPLNIIKNKLKQLFEEQWITEVWDNFVECLNNQMNNE